MPPLPADFTHSRACKPICEKSLTLPVNQVLNYRDKLTKEYYALCHQSSKPFEVMSPKCVIIIGKISSMTTGEVSAFENFRNSLSNISILTFDELYQRIMDLIAVLSNTPGVEKDSVEALPF